MFVTAVFLTSVLETVPPAECTAAYLTNINGCYAIKDGQNTYLLFDSKKALNSEALRNLACNSALNFYTESAKAVPCLVQKYKVLCCTEFLY